MPIYRAVGQALLSQEEFYQLSTSDTFGSGETLRLAYGPVSRTSFADAALPFQDIGLNKPLVVQIRHVYTGRHPHPRRKKNMLLTSAMKSLARFDAAPRAINIATTEKHGAKTDLSNLPATEDGTPLVYYSPALTRGASVLTIQFGFDNFSPEFFDSLGNVLAGAAAIPAFVAHGPYLIGAGMVMKLAAGIAGRFLEKGPVFEVTEPIDFITPGAILPEKGFRLLVPSGFPSQILMNHQVAPGGQLVDAGGVGYSGDWPYVVISLDGSEIDDYRDFEPTQASAAVLESFFNIRDDQDAPLDAILEGLKLYSDLKFRREADKVQERLAAIQDQGSAEATKLKEKLEALEKNILEDKLKP